MEEELKAKLMGQYGELIERILGQAKGAEAIGLDEIEETAIAIGREVQRQVTQEMVEASQGIKESPPNCASCQEPMRGKGKRRKTILTRSAEATLNRDYYYCENCKAGFFPPR